MTEDNCHVLIRERSTGKVVEDMDAYNYSEAQEIREGARINLNHAKFEIVIRQNGESKEARTCN
jgi:hypothetical protein